MSFKALRAIDIRGVSSTGTQHTLHIEQSEEWLRFTVVGTNGKRHATVLVDPTYASERITEFFKEGNLP